MPRRSGNRQKPMSWGKRELRGEWGVVHGSRRADGKALRHEGIEHNGGTGDDADSHRSDLLGMRTAAEAVVTILRGRVASAFLGSRFGAAHLWHQQVGRRPCQQQAGHETDGEVPTEGAHVCED